jgi:hypothetical protein
MYATLILSQSPYGVRQTAIIPTPSGSVRIMYRCGFGRGLGATWIETAPDVDAMQELTLNAPVSLLMTGAHLRDVDFLGRTPNNVLQALGKRISTSFVPSVATLQEVHDTVMSLATTNPVSLSKFAHKQMTVVTVPPVVAPVLQAVIEPVVQDVPEPIAEVDQLVVPTLSANPASSTARSLNILNVPEVTSYHERTFEDIPETKVYDVATKTQQAVLLTGDAGTGKTSSARNCAARRQVPFVVIECTQQIDSSIIQGRFVPEEDGKSVKWVYSQLATAVQQPSVILFNELTRMSPKSASLFLRLLQERELFIEPFNEVIKLHPECLIIADANVGTSYNGTMRQDGALIDRFNIKLNFVYDADLEAKFLPYPALLAFATGIRKASALGMEDFSTPMSTRLLQNFAMHANHFSWDFAVARLLANFPTDTNERDAVKMRLDADAPRIAQDFGVTLNR